MNERRFSVRSLAHPASVRYYSTVDDRAIYLKQMELGPMENFVYLIGDPVARECVVVDPAWEIDTIVETVAADGMTLKGALGTQNQQDHVSGSQAGLGIPGRISNCVA